MKNYDLVILSNAPGEITTWVYPVWQELQHHPLPIRVSVILTPCQNACGTEAELLSSWGIERVLPASQFWRFLLWGQTPNWDWYPKGAVLFLGGDQFYTVLVGKRLGYPTITYVEWQARWCSLVDYLALRHARIAVPARYGHKALVVGDLMLCSRNSGGHSVSGQSQPLVVFLPGSKPHKLQVGVPLSLRTIEALWALADQLTVNLQVAIALAPTVTPEQFMAYAPATFHYQSTGVRTPSGRVIPMHRQFPAVDLLAQASLCVTTVGANTAELALWGVPMLVVLPTSPEYMSIRLGWDGIAGLLNGNPYIARFINWYLVQSIRRRGQKLAWPNIWAEQEIVPELWGDITPESLAKTIIAYLQQPDKLESMRQKLRAVCASQVNGGLNAAQAIAALIAKLYGEAHNLATPLG
jgi:lipid-A-disaccharide synthase